MLKSRDISGRGDSLIRKRERQRLPSENLSSLKKFVRNRREREGRCSEDSRKNLRGQLKKELKQALPNLKVLKLQLRAQVREITTIGPLKGLHALLYQCLKEQIGASNR